MCNDVYVVVVQVTGVTERRCQSVEWSRQQQYDVQGSSEWAMMLCRRVGRLGGQQEAQAVSSLGVRAVAEWPRACASKHSHAHDP